MKIFFVLLAMLLPTFAFTQNVNDVIRELKTELQTKPNAQRTAAIYSDLTWYYSNVAIDSALNYGVKALSESRKLGDSTLMGQVYSDVGAVYFRKGDFVNSKANYLTAYSIRKALKDYPGLAKININLASIYASKQQYKPAVKAYLDAISYFESIGNDNIVNATKENLGYLFMDMKNYPKAAEYISANLAFAKKNNLTDKLCTSYLHLGNVWLQMKDTVKAMSFYRKSISSCKASGNNKGLASAYNNVGTISEAQNKSDEALRLYAQSKAIRSALNSDLDQASLNLNVAKVLINKKQYAEANKMLLDIKRVFVKNNSKGDLLLTYSLLVPVYARSNQPDSVIFYSNQYGILKDQLLGETVVKETAELEARYQTAKKEKLLIEKEAEAQHKNYLLIGISALTLFVALLGMLIYRQQKIRNKQQKQEFQLKSAIAQIETQNQLQEQRLNISRDLHDNIGAQLTFIISSVDNIKYAFDIQNTKLDNKLKSISNFTQSTIVELRDTIWAMNSDEITFEDLRARILNFIEKAKDAREEIDFQFAIDVSLNELKLSSVAGMNIYRTIQEAVNNAIKYAEASEISIDVKRTENKIAISIRDNGIGFDPASIEKGNGLINMEKRIEAIGGIVKLISDFKTGTTVSLLINLNS